MIRSIVFALCLTLPLPSLAECLADVQLPLDLTFNGNVHSEILANEGDIIRYRQYDFERKKFMEMTVQAGIFVLLADKYPGDAATFHWSTFLPGRKDIVPGAKFHAEASVTRPEVAQPNSYVLDVNVLGAEDLNILGCHFPVMKIMVTNREGKKPALVVTKWLHMPTLITLRGEFIEGGVLHVNEVTAIN
ncbi:hypothetical protein [Pseudogemmobacter blasticus]|uniref:hypothetical protein n=1 Tax=Fuscovulum blasticum TaxID=1075 RepID=UPI0011B1CA25|nr:hypothetical protein [Fuscovulum blasticum]